MSATFTNRSSTDESRLGPAFAMLLVVALVALTVGLISSLGTGASATPAPTEVRGVSIATTAFGTTQISSLEDGVNVHVIESNRDATSTTIGLARAGEILAYADLGENQRVHLHAEEPGDYEVWATTTTKAAFTPGEVQLAPSQRIDRIGRVTVGEGQG